MLVKAVEKTAVSSHVLFLGMQNFTEPFLGGSRFSSKMIFSFVFLMGGTDILMP